MSQSMMGLAQRLLATATSLVALQTGLEVDRAGARLLDSLIGSDEVLLTRVDLVGTSTAARTGTLLEMDHELSEGLARLGHLHPAVLSYLREGDDRQPRRVSDVATPGSWRSSVVYEELFRPRSARHQLSLVTQLGPGCGAGWILTRASRDFSDEDVITARLALPLLTAMAELAAVRDGQVPAAVRGLTGRERTVLELLATGMSARHMARELGISEGTTRKHLVHIYSKLGVHDRLSAVLRLNGAKP